MLNLTKRLIQDIKNNTIQDCAIADAYIKSICKRGSYVDAHAALECFIENPSDRIRGGLINIIQKWGNTDCAAILTKHCFSDRRLKEDVPEDVLNCIGYLHYEQAKPLLLENLLDADDYGSNRSAAMGLLHFDCSEFVDILKQEIIKTYNKNWFNEFLPAFVCKINNNQEIIDNLFHYGNTITSSDSNSGIALGFALSGEYGEQFFKKILWDPAWEALEVGGTGNLWFTYPALLYLNISFRDLYIELIEEKKEGLYEYKLDALLNIVEIKIRQDGLPLPLKFISEPKESFEDIYNLLFGYHSTDLGPIFAFLLKTDYFQRRIYDIKYRLKLKIEHEIDLMFA
ncbi:MAG TPA: hypothetical protein PK772_04365 [Chitinophagaceae bacterium]|nr:hypothetical protein [Chitinophagaceae bacterium]